VIQIWSEIKHKNKIDSNKRKTLRMKKSVCGSIERNVSDIIQ